MMILFLFFLLEKVKSTEFKCFDSLCYSLILEKKNFSNAQKYCKEIGGLLAVVDNAEKNKFVIDTFYSDTFDFYIGLDDIDTEGTFVNSYGVVQTFSYWNNYPYEPNEPNDHDGSEDCAVLYKHGGHWNDISCYLELRFLCEKSDNPISIADENEDEDPDVDDLDCE